jgi:hypothetical protein
MTDFAANERHQLTFDVGGSPPDVATLKITGGMRLGRELRKGEPIHVNIIGPDGEVLAEGDGFVAAVGFKDKRNKFGDVESTERTHTAKLA